MSFIARLRKRIQKERQAIKISWLGLDHAGKTTILKRLSQGVFDERNVRTMGMDVHQVLLPGVSGTKPIQMVAWDLGGQITFRESLWESYMRGSMGVVYVVDAADPDRFPEAKMELWKYVINNPQTTGIPILVLANKQDLPNAQPPGKVAYALDLHKVYNHSYSIMPTSAKTGFNIQEALEWLKQRVIAKLNE